MKAVIIASSNNSDYCLSCLKFHVNIQGQRSISNKLWVHLKQENTRVPKSIKILMVIRWVYFCIFLQQDNFFLPFEFDTVLVICLSHDSQAGRRCKHNWIRCLKEEMCLKAFSSNDIVNLLSKNSKSFSINVFVCLPVSVWILYIPFKEFVKNLFPLLFLGKNSIFTWSSVFLSVKVSENNRNA